MLYNSTSSLEGLTRT